MNAFLFAVVMHQGAPDKPVHPGRKPTAAATADTKPVTAREARAAFIRVGELLGKVNGHPLGMSGLPAIDRPVTRAEVVTEMGRLYKAAEPTFKFTPVAVVYDRSKLRIDAALLPTLNRLVTRGMVARLGPLAVGPQPTLTPKQLGDAIGFFTSRVAQMSHLPSAKWTPMLQKG
ncbi:hypothetical protein EON82_06850 [bacterium]|nr:MAG: hypothetical protein EON82_06850 [bacterium]